MLGQAGDMHPLEGAIKNLFLKCSALEVSVNFSKIEFFVYVWPTPIAATARGP